jgi:hypothetical protein
MATAARDRVSDIREEVRAIRGWGMVAREVVTLVRKNVMPVRAGVSAARGFVTVIRTGVTPVRELVTVVREVGRCLILRDLGGQWPARRKFRAVARTGGRVCGQPHRFW